MAHINRDAQRVLGAWYTPPDLVQFLVRVAQDLGASPATILDPACGDGRLLRACAAVWPEAQLEGWEIDATVASRTAAALPKARILAQDALTAISEPFDLVIGNPPFLGQLRGVTVQDAARAQVLRQRFGELVRPYTDIASLFLALAAELGKVAVMIQPVSVLATRDSGTVRARLTPRLRAICAVAGDRFEGADVHVVVVGLGASGNAVQTYTPALEQGEVRGMDERWSRLISQRPAVPLHTGTLGDIATAKADFRDEYYALQGLVREYRPGDHPLVVSGLIDPGIIRWGERPARIHKQIWQRPAIAVEQTGAVQRWVQARTVPKVLLAMQTPVLEPAADLTGQYLPVTPVVSIIPKDPAMVAEIERVLRMPWATAWARAEFAGAGLGFGPIKVSARGILGLPWPD